MEEIKSYQIHLKQELQTNDVMEFYEFAKESNQAIYVYRENLIADAKNFPKLLSFFFVTPKQSSIVIIIDGENAKERYVELEQLLNKQLTNAELRTSQSGYKDLSIAI